MLNVNGLAFNEIQRISQDCSLAGCVLFQCFFCLNNSLVSFGIVKAGIFHIKIMLLYGGLSKLYIGFE